jgi:Tol biopolymer transport system component
MVLIRLRSAALASIVGLLVLLSGCGSENPPYNDTPSITSLFPSSAVAGGPGFTLNVAGNGFISTSVVYWNNTARTTTYNTSSTQLSISVTAQDIASPGTAQVVVVTPAPGGGPSVAVNFTITSPQNPQPTITSLSPSSTPVGVLPSGGLLIVNGTNFVSSSSVAFNGNLRATTLVSSTQLRVMMTAADVAANATIGVSVSNPAPAGGVSGSLPFTVGTGAAVRLKASLAAGAQFPQVVSASAGGGPANGASSGPAVSSDGRFVAFYSTSTDLVAQGASGSIFVRDTCLGAAGCMPQTTAVDLAPDGSAPSVAAENEVAISGDGRFVAFASSATNLVTSVSGPPPLPSNVYVRDLCVGTEAPSGCVAHTELVSIAANGDSAALASSSPSLSSDGRFVAFVSAASSLVAGFAVAGNAVYVRDTCAGQASTAACVPHTYSASADISNEPSPQRFSDPVISPDGRYVVLEVSNAATAGAANQTASQLLLVDTCLGVSDSTSCVTSTVPISISADRSPLRGLNQGPSISGDARFIAFQSSDSGATPNVFLRDTCLGIVAGCVPSTTLLIENAAAPHLSSNGRYVSFVANPSGTTDGAAAVTSGSLYVYDTCAGAAETCTPASYPITASSPVSGSSPLTVNASPVPLTSDGSFLFFSTSAGAAGLPLSLQGDVLLTATPF